MENEIAIHESKKLKDKIYTIRGVQVMLDADLAQIYGYATKAFNQQVKNNIERFDDDFRFQLTDEEVENLRSKFLTSNWGGTRYNPYAFTEQGIYMLLTVNSTTKMHDRFLIIDKKTLYHIGASLKDLGKKCFAFEILDASLIPVLLQNV
mgnify:CR=1 FL=1